MDLECLHLWTELMTKHSYNVTLVKENNTAPKCKHF